MTADLARVAPATGDDLLRDRTWQALRYFNLYRIIIAALFAVLGWLKRLPPNFTQFDERLLTITAAAYFMVAVLLQFAIESRSRPLGYLRNGQVLLDVTALTLFMHASGGVAGGFGILMVIAIAGACLLASWRSAVFFAALATLAVLGETLFGIAYHHYAKASYTQAGLLGATFFATATLAAILAERARTSERLAAQRALDIEQLSRLNEHIVQRMRSGIVVLDADDRLVLLNDAACRMLKADASAVGRSLPEVSPALEAARVDWWERGENRRTPIALDARGTEALVSFTGLGAAATGSTLAFVEDAAEIHQHAQQIKLASLGRLTASIAHEIRNPLGAISHAGQLLSESPELPAEDRRLTQIIAEHSARMNDIIENVMLIGRRGVAVAESFPLRPWLEAFVGELGERRGLPADAITVTWRARNMVVRMDPSQLRQVLLNLCENALRYSQRAPVLRFECAITSDTGRPYIDLIDTGPGMSAATAIQIFEPFFTGDRGGTGLGLYIARELCEANQATLALLAHDPEGCRFRITFAHPDRQQLSA